MSRKDLKISMEAPLIQDNETQRRVAGVRQGGTMPRQLLYRAGKLFVDLQVQPRPDSSELVLTGQIVGGENDSRGFGDLQVDLEYEDGTQVSSRSTETGEFLLVCPPGPGATLEVEIEDWLGLELQLPSNALANRGDHRS